MIGGSGARWSRTGSGVRNTWHWRLVLLFTLWFPLNELVHHSEPLFPYLWNRMIILQFHLGSMFKQEQHTRRSVKSKTLASSPRFHTFQSWLIGPLAIHLWITGKCSISSPSFTAHGNLLKVLFDTKFIVLLSFSLLDLKVAFKCSYSFKGSTLLIAPPE